MGCIRTVECEGSTFIVKLLLMKDEIVEKMESILIVDNDRGVLKSLPEVLESEDYDVDSAETVRSSRTRERCQVNNLGSIPYTSRSQLICKS